MRVREVKRRDCVANLEMVSEMEVGEKSEATWISVRETVELARMDDSRPMNFVRVRLAEVVIVAVERSETR